MKTLVLGLGNPILGDDSVGIRVARELENRLTSTDVTVMEASLAGLSLLDLLTGFDRAIIIDAIQTGNGQVGQVYRLKDKDFGATRLTGNSHYLNLATALELGKKLGQAIPREIIIFAIEVADVTAFSEECTPEVALAIPVAAGMVTRELEATQWPAKG